MNNRPDTKPASGVAVGREQRRKLLKSLCAGAGAVAGGQALPEQWRKPSVSSVVLPSHARATGFSCVVGGSDVTADDGTLEYSLESPEFDAPDGTTVLIEAVVENSTNEVETSEGIEEYTRVIENGTISEVDGTLTYEGIVSEFEVEFQIEGGGTCQFEVD